MNLNKVLLSLLAATAAAARGEEIVVERGPHHEVRRKVEQIVENGGTNEVVREWTVLQTGINFWNGAEWSPSTKTIQVAPVGAVFKEGPIKVRFSPNQNDPAGSLEFTLPFPDERKIKMQTIGIALTDGNQSVWIGEAQDSNGFLDGNSVTYPDAFSGLYCDIQFRVEANGELHNDVVLREKISQELLDALGFNAETVRLDVWHRVISAPEGVSHRSNIVRADGSVDADEQLQFGDSVHGPLYFGPGTAFLVGTNHLPAAAGGRPMAVAKELFHDPQSQSKFMIESIRLAEARAQIDTLGAREEAWIDWDALKRELSVTKSVASKSRRLPARLNSITSARVKSNASNRAVAAITHSPRQARPGFVVDYTTLAGGSNMRLYGNTTYLVTGEVNLFTSCVIEGGTVVKFSPYTNLTPVIKVHGTLSCLTSPNLPAIFTADADNSVGETISTNALSGYYGYYNLLFTTANSSSIDVHDIHTRYAHNGIGLQGTNTHYVSNIQAINCFKGLESYNNTVYLRNFLAHNSVYSIAGGNTTVRAEHVTAHNATQRLFNHANNSSLYLTNSLVVGMAGTSTNVYEDHVTTLASDVGVFQTVGAGAHYLADNTYRSSAGSMSDAAQKLLKHRTTRPPIELSNPVIVDTVLFPVVERDGLKSSGGAIGYHYSAIDYLMSGLVVTNATLTLSNGVAVAGHEGSIFKLQGSGKLVSHGRPERMNVITTIDTVQEKPSSYATNLTTFIEGHSMDLRFTEVSTLAGNGENRTFGYGDYAGQAKVRDSVMRNLLWQIYNPDNSQTSEAILLNNIFERCIVALGQETSSMFYLDAQVRNNLFLGGEFAVLHYGADMGLMEIKDNFFDQGALTFYENAVAPFPYGAALTGGYNAYSVTNAIFGGAGNKTSITASYETGPLGKYYYPTSGGANSLTNLVNTGSVNDASLAGLYHFTTQYSLAKETNSIVDIGFHYISTDSSGVPLDQDADGSPDYFEDLDGDETVDSGETNWQDSTDLGLKVLITQPKVNSKIP